MISEFSENMNGISRILVDATYLGRGENAFVGKNQNHYGLIITGLANDR